VGDGVSGSFTSVGGTARAARSRLPRPSCGCAKRPLGAPAIAAPPATGDGVGVVDEVAGTALIAAATKSSGSGIEEGAPSVVTFDIVKDVRGSESNCEQDSRTM
jgi:hypothetical protein